MSYTHKKSLRTITDEQFSEGTTIDGTRIDKALQDTVDRYNEIPRGDISTRFVSKQYVFGYQPFEYKIGKTLAQDINSTTFRRSWTRLPWTFVVNNEYTTLDPQPGAPVPLPDDYEHKADDYGNRFRYKGTYMDSLHEDTTAKPDDTAWRAVALNRGQWYDDFWMRWWLQTDVANPVTGSSHDGRKVLSAKGTSAHANSPNSSTAPATYIEQDNSTSPQQKIGCMEVRNHYQMAWSHSWAFADATVVDDLMVFLRTDTTRYTASFKDELINSAGSIAAGEDGYNQFGDADHLIVQLSVDSPFDRTDRRLNSVIVMQHQVNLRDIDYLPLPVSDAAHVRDMNPPIGTAADKAPQGPIVRLRDLNIPLPPGSNLRLAIIIPWFAEKNVVGFFDQTTSGSWPFVDTKTLTVTSATAGNPTTIVTQGPHGLTVGDKVTGANFTDSGAGNVNTTTAVASVVSATEVTVSADTSAGLGVAADTTVTIQTLVHGFNHQMGWSVDKAEPMVDWAPSGCLTVLQEIKK